MKAEEAAEMLKHADWFEYYPSDGSLRLDGYFTDDELEAFVWALRNKPELLQRK